VAVNAFGLSLIAEKELPGVLGAGSVLEADGEGETLILSDGDLDAANDVVAEEFVGRLDEVGGLIEGDGAESGLKGG
jgi:hypothetical protein